MAIEFTCQGCGKAMRAPESSAGKQGKCPQCGTVNAIPQPSLSSSTASSADAGTAGTIEFPCENCGKTMRTPAAAAGKKGKCPGCGHVTTIPTASRAAKPTGEPAPAGPIEFFCPSCGSVVKTPGAAAGKKGKCPHCQAIVDIPKQSARRPSTSAGAGGLSGGLTPLPGGGLTPLDGGLTPLGGGLTPLGTPHDPLGPAAGFGGAFPGDPLGGAGGAPFDASAYGAPAYGAPSANPYAASSYYEGGPTRRTTATPNDSNRRGIAWERKGADASMMETITDVIMRPGEAFGQMRRSGNGLLRAILFPYLTSAIGAVALTVIMAVISGLQMMFAAQNAPANVNGATLIFAWLIAVVFLFFYFLISGAIGVTFTISVGAGLMHLCLMIAGGARYSFEVTVRVLCYSLGANYVLSLLPCIGIVSLVTYPMSIIVGMSEAHETDTWRAALAFFLPMILVCMLCAGLFALGFFAPIIAALGRLPQAN